MEYEIRGKEHINVNNGGVVLLNHQSAIDIVRKFLDSPLLGRLSPNKLLIHACSFVVLSRLLREFRNIVPVVKKELFYALPFGIASYLVGVVFIDRKNISSAKDVMAREAVAIQRDNVSDDEDVSFVLFK